MKKSRGAGLVGWIVALALVGLAAAAALPSAGRLLAGARGAAGAREMATRFMALRWKSVATHRAHGMHFVQDLRGWKWFVVRDGNGNGVRTAEVRSGVDPTLSGPHRLESLIEDMTPGFPPRRSFPRIPPARGALGALGDPVKFGPSNVISFSPLGTSSSGTLYVTDGQRQLWGVRLYGHTTRVRVWRFTWDSGRWTL